MIHVVSLFLQNSVRSLELDLGEDRIVLQGHPRLYCLDIFIPYSIVPEDSRAQFHKRTKVSNQDSTRCHSSFQSVPTTLFPLESEFRSA